MKAKDEVFAVAMRAPSYSLALSKVTEVEALELIAQDLYQRYGELPSSSGLVDETKAFAQIWQTLTGQSYKLISQRRIYRLDQVQPIQKAPSSLQVATEADRSSGVI